MDNTQPIVSISDERYEQANILKEEKTLILNSEHDKNASMCKRLYKASIFSFIILIVFVIIAPNPKTTLQLSLYCGSFSSLMMLVFILFALATYNKLQTREIKKQIKKIKGF